MAHPFKGEAAGTSRSKMRAITGKGGGGSPFVGMSSFKRPGPGGEINTYRGHDKTFAAPTAHGGRVKRRADKFARGGKVKRADGGKTDEPKYDRGAKRRAILESMRGYNPDPRFIKSPRDEPAEPITPEGEKSGGRIKRAGGGRAFKRGGLAEQHFKSEIPGISREEGRRLYATLAHRGEPGPEDPKVYRDMAAVKKGGKVKKAGGGPTGTGPKFGHSIEHGRDLPGAWERSVEENPQEVQRRWLGPMGRQKDWTTPKEMDVYHSVAPGYERDYGHVDPSGAPIEPSGPPTVEPEEDVPQSRRGGRIKRADGGRTMMPYGNEQRRRVASKAGKRGGNVNIAINMPPHLPRPGGGMPPMPPGGLPGGAGGPPGMPPGGGAPPPPIPPALMGGAMPGAMPGGAPGGMNPAAMQALAGIAGGQGGPMGAGMPGRGPFAKGGAVKSTGLASNLRHWQDYANKNVKGNTAHNRGATGESAELPLRTPDHVRGASDAAVAKRRGGRGASGKYAKGGKIPVPMTGGSDSGVGRKRMAELQPKYR